MPQIEIGYKPAQAMARVILQNGEQFRAESGAMVGMSTNVHMETGSTGGIMSGLKRMFGGESFFQNTFTAQGGPGEVLLAHSLSGDIVSLPMTPNGYFIQSSSYIGGDPWVHTETKVGGFKSFFAGEGVFVLKATAQQEGQVLVGAFGGIQELQCDGNIVIDTGHLVAWDTTLEYSVGKSGSGWIASFLSGEGLVCHFTGQGRIWIQTRNPQEFGSMVGRMLPPREN
ncbi:MAG: TIGR00266 family protein [Deltaproteobacteria bacterium]|nr:TIGR00266 family protein [Deltaproteobacteria bacterium]